jgi:arginine-tRNA-protein transferase
MKFGITSEFDCSYLPSHKERLLVCVESSHKLNEAYSQLTSVGFRRSGEQLYRPHCIACQKCHSIRIPVVAFKASKSQKRLSNKNRDLSIKLSPKNRQAYYELFERYINELHSDGSMYPTSPEQYFSFTNAEWTNPLFIEAWHEDKLVAVAVTDRVGNSYSALYTFYEPTLQARSLGSFMVLKQIELCLQHHKDYLYLGYQIDECRKMNYKTKFAPYERFFDEKWHLYTK